MNKRSRGHAKRGPPEVRSRARLREAAVLLPTRAGDGRDCCLFLPPNFFGFERANAHTRRETRVAIESNHHESYPSPLRTVPNAPCPKRRHFLPRFSSVESRATTKTFFLASIFGLQRRKTRARRSFVSPLPRAVGSHPASPFFVSPKMTARLLAASPSSASALAHRRRGLGSRRAFFCFFFHLGLFPAGVSASSSESPGSRPPSYQHRSLSCDSIFEKSNPPRLHFCGSSILRSRK